MSILFADKDNVNFSNAHPNVYFDSGQVSDWKKVPLSATRLDMVAGATANTQNDLFKQIAHDQKRCTVGFWQIVNLSDSQIQPKQLVDTV